MRYSLKKERTIDPISSQFDVSPNFLRVKKIWFKSCQEYFPVIAIWWPRKKREKRNFDARKQINQ